MADTTPPGDIPAIHPSAEPFRLSPREFLTAYFQENMTMKTPSKTPTVLGTGAIVFDRPLSTGPETVQASLPLPPPRVLLVQRAPHDSMPLKWEVPGGGCDDEDPSILASCARELWEETGLRATGAGPLVPCPLYHDEDASEGTYTSGVSAESNRLRGQFFRSRSGKLVCKFQFVMQVALSVEEGQKERVKVKLDPNEHFAYTWATEDEVRRKRVDVDTNLEGIVRADGENAEGTVLEFASREQWDIVLAAFKLWHTE